MARYLTAILAVSLLSAQEPAESSRPSSVRGVVTSITGPPVRKADVILRTAAANGEQGVRAASTDASGAFAFENVRAGNYLISAQRNGFVRLDGVRRPGGSPPVQGITVVAGQDVSGIVIKLVPHSVITGKVTDEDSEPMFGASVNILEERYNRGRRTLIPRANGTVNDLGHYRIPGLPAGRYFIAVEPRQEFGSPVTRTKQAGQEAERSFVTAYYPGVVDQNQAAPINLEAGQEARGIDVQIRKSPTVHIRGLVADEAGNPVTNTAVAVINGDSPSVGMGRSVGVVRPDGSFDVPSVPPGNHILMENRMTREQGRSVGLLHVQVGSRDMDDVVLRMAAPAQVTGTIKAVDNPSVQNVRVALDPMDSFPFDMHSSRSLTEGNSFTIADVTPGRYRVDVYGAPDGYYLQSVRVTGQDFTSSGMTISGSVAGLELSLAKGAVNVEGSVTDADGKGVGQSLIALVPPPDKRDQWRLFKTSIADQNGRFVFRNLSPGEYTLLAFGANGDPSVVQNPEYLKQIESKGTVVKLGENAREPVKLKVIG